MMVFQSLKEASTVMNVGTKTLRAWIQAGRLEGTRVSRGRDGGASVWLMYRDIVKAAGRGWTWPVKESALVEQLQPAQPAQPKRAVGQW